MLKPRWAGTVLDRRHGPWAIALAALALSFTGILFLGVGFLFTSVWFWQVAGFSFATAMAQRHELTMRAAQP